MRKPKCLVIGRPCPRNADQSKGDYCPWWWRESEVVNGKDVVNEICGVSHLPKYLTSLHHMMTHAAEEASSLKNDARGIIERKLDAALAPIPTIVHHYVQHYVAPRVIGPADPQNYIEFKPPENKC